VPAPCAFLSGIECGHNRFRLRQPGFHQHRHAAPDDNDGVGIRLEDGPDQFVLFPSHVEVRHIAAFAFSVRSVPHAENDRIRTRAVATASAMVGSGV